MDLKRIKQLLEKFYDGNTTFEEENVLERFFYFQSKEIPDDLKPDRDYFLSGLSLRRNVPENPKLKKNLIGLIDKQEKKMNKSKRVQLYYAISSIAASVAIIGYFMIQEPKTKPEVNDSFNDPKIAYEQMKSTLLYISENLSIGTRSLEQVSYLNQGLNELSVFSAFSSGLKDLELVSKYYNENNVEIKK